MMSIQGSAARSKFTFSRGELKYVVFALGAIVVSFLAGLSDQWWEWVVFGGTAGLLLPTPSQAKRWLS